MDYSNSEMQGLINEYIHNDRDAEILRLHLICGHSHERIAAEIRPQMSGKQVGRIIRRDAAKLYRYLSAPE